MLTRQNRLPEALEEVRRLLASDPANPNYLLLEGNVLVQMGDHEHALERFERVLAIYPNQPRAQMNYGHTLKTVGRLDESIAAYRRCIALQPDIGEAYWSLANLKTYRFTDAEIVLMREQLAATKGKPEDQSHLAFALGKALEDRGEFDESFSCYERGNRIRKVKHRHDVRINVFDTARQMKTLTAEFFAARQGWGCPAPDPIFIVGLPRSGSTLLEQILASHSQVQGTAELMDVIQISRLLGEKSRRLPASKYPEVLATLDADRFRGLGEGYVASTRVQRNDRPFFIDKMPNNFRHVGLIHLMLPNAKIIDARRHPMACCFSGFKQLFASGQTFSYGLEEIGKYYRDYVFLMDHWDRVLPGRVLRVEYEDMVADTGNQVRRLLDYCRLPFEEQCLRFWETERAVRTPSSEQVRQPIYRSGLEQWRNFEKHLGPLKEALGPVLERYEGREAEDAERGDGEQRARHAHQEDRHVAVVQVGLVDEVVERPDPAQQASRVRVAELRLDLAHHRVAAARLRAHHVDRRRPVLDARKQHDVVELVPADPGSVHVLDDPDRPWSDCRGRRRRTCRPDSDRPATFSSRKPWSRSPAARHRRSRSPAGSRSPRNCGPRRA